MIGFKSWLCPALTVTVGKSLDFFKSQFIIYYIDLMILFMIILRTK